MLAKRSTPPDNRSSNANDSGTGATLGYETDLWRADDELRTSRSTELNLAIIGIGANFSPEPNHEFKRFAVADREETRLHAH